MNFAITKQDIINGLLDLGLKSGNEIEVRAVLDMLKVEQKNALTVN